MHVLTSEDSSLLQQYEQKNLDQGATFLDGSDIPQVFLACLMRSGNSLLRSMIEKVTGVSTGSATSANFTPRAFQLLIAGFKGQGVSDQRV